MLLCNFSWNSRIEVYTYIIVFNIPFDVGVTVEEVTLPVVTLDIAVVEGVIIEVDTAVEEDSVTEVGNVSVVEVYNVTELGNVTIVAENSRGVCAWVVGKTVM